MRFIWLGDVFQHFYVVGKFEQTLLLEFLGATATSPAPRYVRPCLEHLNTIYTYIGMEEANNLSTAFESMFKNCWYQIKRQWYLSKIMG